MVAYTVNVPYVWFDCSYVIYTLDLHSVLVCVPISCKFISSCVYI